MSKHFTIDKIARSVAGAVRGDPDRVVTGVGSLEEAGAHQITWLAQDALAKKLPMTRAGAVLVRPDLAEAVPAGSAAIVVDRPHMAIIEVLSMFDEPMAVKPGIDPTAVIDPTASLDENVRIGPHAVVGAAASIGPNSVLHAGVFVGPGSRVGADCVLWPHVVVRERCTIGNRVIIHSNSTIGTDGFGYEFDAGRHVKVPQIGTVVIGDDVEVGAGTCIDRAKFGATTVGAGTKIDNLVQIGHNVRIGAGAILVAQVGVGGSARIGSFAVLGGQVGVVDHATVGNRAVVAAVSAVTGEVPDGQQVAGIYAYDIREWRRSQIAVRRLPKLLEQVKELARRVAELESAKDDSKRS